VIDTIIEAHHLRMPQNFIILKMLKLNQSNPKKRHYQNGRHHSSEGDNENGGDRYHHRSTNGGDDENSGLRNHRDGDNNDNNKVAPEVRPAAVLKSVGERNPVMKIAESIIEQNLIKTLDDEYGTPKVGDLVHVIGIVWNSTQLKEKLILIYNREEVPVTLMTLERAIKDMVDTTRWESRPIQWKYVFFGISVTCVFLSIICMVLIHSICCSKKKKQSLDESKKPMLEFKA